MALRFPLNRTVIITGEPVEVAVFGGKKVEG